MADSSEQSAKRWQTWLKQFVSQHFFTIVAILLATFVLVSVPQINASFFELPSKTVQRIGFLGFALLTTGWLVLTLIRFLEWFGRFPRIHDAACLRWIDLPLDWVLKLSSRGSRFAKGVWGYLIPVVITTVAVAFVWMTTSHTPMPLIGYALTGSLRVACVYAIGASLWLLFGRFFKAHQTASGSPVENLAVRELHPVNQRIAAWNTVGRAIGFLMAMALVGEAVWLSSAYQLIPLASLRLYSLWAILQVLATTIVIAGVIDFLDNHTGWPWRIIAAVVFVGSLSTVRPETIGIAQPETTAVLSRVSAVSTSTEETEQDSADSIHPWYRAVNERLDAMPGGPVVLVSASGGGSRAAVFTAMVLEYLDQKPMSLPQIVDTDAEPNRLDTDSTWGDHILWLSSVSGGTLATGRYLDLRRHGLALHRYDRDGMTQTVDDHEWALKARVYADSLVRRMIEDHSERVLETKQIEAIRDAVNEKLGDFATDPIKDLGSDPDSRPVNESIQASLDLMLRSRFVDEMGTDYMAPIYRGFLQPLETRGAGLFGFWNHQFDWSEWSRNQWREKWTPTQQPFWLVNVTDIDHGRRVIIGCPELPPRLLPARGILPRQETSNGVNQTVRASDHQPYTFSSLDPGGVHDLPLSRLVRLSSSFPFGFRPAVVSIPMSMKTMERDSASSKDLPTKIHLLDGGIIDNTGIDSIHALILSLQQRASQFGDQEAIALLGRLRMRGVVFVEIDSGARPDLSASSDGGFAWLSQPISALSKATYTTALQSSDTRLADLKRHLSLHEGVRVIASLIEEDFRVGIDAIGLKLRRDDLIRIAAGILMVSDQDPPLSSFLADRLTCHVDVGDDAQVMTAFALTPNDKAKILIQFLMQADQWETTADRMADELQQRKLYDGRDAALGRRDKLITFLSLLEAAGQAINKLQSGAESNPLLVSRQQFANRITTPLAALTLAGLIAQDSTEEGDIQNVVSLSTDLQQLVQLARQGKTDELLVRLDPTAQAGVSLAVPESSVALPEPRDPEIPVVFGSAGAPYADDAAKNIWTKIVDDTKLDALITRSKTVQRSPSSAEDTESSPTEIDLTEDFETYKNKRQRKSSELFQKR